MHYTKRLVFYILFLGMLFPGQNSFRGLNKDQILHSRVPISFTHHIASNYDILPQQLSAVRGSYLIISREGLVNQGYVDVFADFKKTQGFDVSVVALSDSELDVNIVQDYITQYYNDDPMLEYVLLIGDVDGFAEIPSYYYGPENDVTDQKYTHLSGDDFIPDVFIGRISVDSAYELAVIMLKTISYVREPLAYDQNWLDRALVVAGNYANTPPIPITPKWTSYWLRDELIDYGYSSVDTVFYPPIQQGAPYITEIIDNGVGIVNYRGWGDANGWHYPEFHADDVTGLNNGWMTPVFMSYVCNSNDFANNVDPCFSEAMLRGGTTTNPKGGVAFIGPSDLHTSTKYNNVINASMYDAMINHGVVELGPALMAGQSGLVKEFPNQNEPGEAQEFYFHVYNILGDPSLQVYLDTPDVFSFTSNNVSSSDGYVHIRVVSSSGTPVEGAVIAIMSGTQLLSKGITTRDGVYANNIRVDNITELSIYANKGGFIQGHHSVIIQENNNHNLQLNGLTLLSNGGHSVASFGSYTSLTLNIKNTLSSISSAFEASLNFNEGIYPSSQTVSVPDIAGQDSVLVAVDDIFIIGNGDYNHNALAQMTDQNGNEIFNICLNIEPMSLEVKFANDDAAPSAMINPVLQINNYSAAAYHGSKIELSSLSDGVQVIHNNQQGLVADIDPFSNHQYQTDYSIDIGSVSYGSTLTFLLKLTQSDSIFYSQEIELTIDPQNENIPVSPSEYGYWAYDDLDIGFEQKPNFEWIELDPSYGGSQGVEYLLDDDDHFDINIPFQVQYHGELYSEMTVSSNGWVSLVPCNIDYFWNMSIPSFMSPKAMLAPFWDDLEVVGQDWIRVYTWYDSAGGRFVIEWSRALNGYDELTEETFEIIIYENSSISTESGDNVIEFQYLEIDDVDVTKNYSTVGIQSPKNNDGLPIIFNNNYAPGAAPLSNGRVIRFTTESPESYVSPLEIEIENFPDQFTVRDLYPNPFNPRINFNVRINSADKINISVVDMLGRSISNIYSGAMVAGNYNFFWDGNNSIGKQVSSGTYFLVVSNKNKKLVKKMLYLK